MLDTKLPQIPIIDARRRGAAEIAQAAEDRLRDLLRVARRLVTPPLLGLGDRVARRWLQRNRNPYLEEIETIAALLPGKGAYALNTSYEWCCTSGVGDDPEGGIRLVRVLDWGQPGLGRNLLVAWHTGPAGDFANITWPGFVGVITALAPGRFAVALNQPPMPRSGLSLLGDWVLGRVQVWQSRALPPAHLLRAVCERCATFDEAKQVLQETPLCISALFTLAGTQPGEGCVIERTPDAAAVREMPAAAANHWDAMAKRGRPRGRDSHERQRRMTDALVLGQEWCAPPIINRYTCVAAVMNPAIGSLTVQGWERTAPVTAELRIRG
jgi:Acyl-coenzyme A:6-aminopenicillanic acid acyl-transferase